VEKHLIFLGAPGSGKGTQAKLMVSECGYNHLSTGDLLRAEVAKQTSLGLKAKAIMESGALVGDDIVLELLKKNCELDKHSYLFDGFPRNITQAKALDEAVLKGHNALAVYFHIDLNFLKERLVNRRACGQCGAIYNLLFSPPKIEGVCDTCGSKDLKHRDDDKEEAVVNRLKVFESTIAPVLSYYESKGVLRRVDASKKVLEVFGEVKKSLEK
jgi:adenylate kinase